MPTGYTAAIADGISFKTFILNCSRAFGALISMRDDPADEPIPEAFAPCTYNADELTKQRARLAQLEDMTPEQAERAAASSWDKAETARLQRAEERQVLRAKYDVMLAKAAAWEPPTPEHNGLRDFMVEQITSSIDHDCSDAYDRPTERLTGADWLEREKAEVARSVEYHTKADAEEVERAASRTAWVKALRDSLS